MKGHTSRGEHRLPACAKLTITPKGAKLLTEPNKLPESFTSRESVDSVGLLCHTVAGSAQKAIAVINSDSVVL